MGTGTKHTAAEIKQAAFTLLLAKEPQAATARRYGVSEVTLAKWRDNFLEVSSAVIPAGKPGAEPQVMRQQNEFDARCQTICELKVTSRFLRMRIEGG